MAGANGVNIIPIDLEAPLVGGVLDPFESWSRFIDLLSRQDIRSKLAKAIEVLETSVSEGVFELGSDISISRDTDKWLKLANEQSCWHSEVTQYLEERDPTLEISIRELVGTQSDCYSGMARISKPIVINTQVGNKIIRGD